MANNESADPRRPVQLNGLGLHALAEGFTSSTGRLKKAIEDREVVNQRIEEIEESIQHIRTKLGEQANWFYNGRALNIRIGDTSLLRVTTNSDALGRKADKDANITIERIMML